MLRETIRALCLALAYFIECCAGIPHPEDQPLKATPAIQQEHDPLPKPPVRRPLKPKYERLLDTSV